LEKLDFSSFSSQEGQNSPTSQETPLGYRDLHTPKLTEECEYRDNPARFAPPATTTTIATTSPTVVTGIDPATFGAIAVVVVAAAAIYMAYMKRYRKKIS